MDVYVLSCLSRDEDDNWFEVVGTFSSEQLARERIEYLQRDLPYAYPFDKAVWDIDKFVLNQ